MKLIDTPLFRYLAVCLFFIQLTGINAYASNGGIPPRTGGSKVLVHNPDNGFLPSLTSDVADALPPCNETLQMFVTPACSGDSSQFAVNFTGSTNNATFTWYFGDGSQSVNAPPLKHVYNGQGNYTAYVILHTPDGCNYTDTNLVQIPTVPNLFGPDSILFCNTGPITPQLTINTTATYSWTPASGLSSNIVLNPDIDGLNTNITYTLTATNNCGTDTHTTQVSVGTPPNLVGDNLLNICYGDTVQIHVSGLHGADMFWYPPQTLDSAQSVAPNVFPHATTTYYGVAHNECGYDTLSTLVQVATQPNLSPPQNYYLCDGDTVHATVAGASFATWNWYPSVGLSDSHVQSPDIHPSQTISYQVIANNACGGDTTQVTAHVIQLNPYVSGDTMVCPGVPFQLHAFGGFFYSWKPAYPLYNPYDSATTGVLNRDTTFSVVISGGTCKDTVYHPVHVYKGVGFTVMDTIRLYPGDALDLNAFQDTFNVTVIDPPKTQFPDIDSTYLITYVDTNFCKYKLLVPVIVHPVIYVPNTFTPNADGKNDLFKVVGLNLRSFEIWVFDRWGNEVYHSQNIQEGWDGGDPKSKFYAPSGTYLYRISARFKDGQEYKKSGFVNLLR